MDSQVCRQTYHMNSYDQLRSESKVDLTLRLGFPNGAGDRRDHSLLGQPDNKPFSATTNDVDYNARQTHQVMVNNPGLAFGGRNGNSEPNYNPCQILWSKELKTYVLKSNHFGQLQSSSFNHEVKGLSNASSANNFVNLPPQRNDLYTLLKPTSRRLDDFEAEVSCGVWRRGWRRRQVSSCSDPDKRCTNYNCNTNITPMWRRGPLGPKTLCNACGIRYRKEKINREAMVAGNSPS